MIPALPDILSKSTKMFLEYGLRSVSMDDIASSLGISKKTLYQLFSNKQDLIRQALNNELHKRSNEVKALLKAEQNAIEQLIEIQNLIIEFLKKYSSPIEFDLKKYYPEIYIEIHSKYTRMLQRLFILNIRKGKREGLYRKDLNAPIIAKLHTSRILNIPQSEVISIEDYTSKEYLNEMIHYHLRALLNSKSIPTLDNYLYELKH